ERGAVHRGDAGPGPLDPHRRGDAGEQLPALADLLRRAVGDADAVARLRAGGAARGAARLRRPEPPVRRPAVGARIDDSVLKHRLIAGSLLAAAMGGVLYADAALA